MDQPPQSGICIRNRIGGFHCEVFLAPDVYLKNEMEIAFKPAPMRSPQSWSIHEQTLTTPNGEQIELTAVTQCQFSDLPVKRYWVSQLTLKTASQNIVISCNDTRSGVQRQYYFAFIFEVLNALQIHNPSVPIQRGTGQAFNIAFAGIGLIPIGFSLKFFADAVQGGSASGLALGFGIFFILMGAFIIWSASPWQKPPTESPAGLIAWLQSWLGGMGTLPKANARK